MLKKGIVFIIFILSSINLVLSATVVEVKQQELPPVSNWYDFFKSPIFWGILLFVFLFIIISIGIIFLIKWIVSFIKSKNDVFYKVKKERLYLSKVHGRYPHYNHFYKITKNPPIRLVNKSDTSLKLSKPIGYYRGDYVTNEGNLCIAMNMIGDNLFMLFPKRSLLVIPNREVVKIKQIDLITNKPNVIEIRNIPTAKEIVQFNEDEILIFADSLASSGMFLIPVLKSKDGKIIDLALPIFQTLKENFAIDYLYEQTDDFSRLSKKAMDLNPNVRAMEKLSDSNKNIEVSDDKR